MQNAHRASKRAGALLSAVIGIKQQTDYHEMMSKNIMADAACVPKEGEKTECKLLYNNLGQSWTYASEKHLLHYCYLSPFRSQCSDLVRLGVRVALCRQLLVCVQGDVVVNTEWAVALYINA